MIRNSRMKGTRAAMQRNKLGADSGQIFGMDAFQKSVSSAVKFARLEAHNSSYKRDEIN